MSLELITGKAGSAHVDSDDIGAFNAALHGSGVYIISGCSAAMTTSNTFKIEDGEILAEGRHVRIMGGGQTANIKNGQSGYKRNDIVALKYEKNSSGIESVSLYVVDGTKATENPSDPSMPSSGKVIDGASVAYWPLYRVVLDGLSVSSVEAIAGTPTTPVSMGGTGASSAAAARTNLGIVGAVIESGETDGWKWVKTSDNRAFCWTVKDTTLNITSEWEGKEFHCRKDYNLPIGFASVDCATCTPIIWNQIICAQISAIDKSGDDYRVIKLIVSSLKSISNASVKLNLFVAGTCS